MSISKRLSQIANSYPTQEHHNMNKNTAHPPTPAEHAFRGLPSEQLSALVDAAERQTPAVRRAEAERLLDDQLGIRREPTPEERAEQARQRAELAERRLVRLASEMGFGSVREMLDDFDTDDEGDETND